jgi:hypothetical protein
MRTRATLNPGQKGTRKLMQMYGKELLCVRYRYDEERKKRVTTVELVVSEAPWQPPKPKPKPAAPSLVKVRIAFGEKALQQQVREAGGQWNRAERVWEVPAECIEPLSLAGRVVEAPNAGKPKAATKGAKKVSTRRS